MEMANNLSMTNCTHENIDVELYHMIVYIFWTFLVTFAGFGLNAYVLHAITTHTTLQTYANGFVASLCITDLLCILSLIGRTSSWIARNPFLELIADKMFCISSGVSVMLLAAIAVDRFASLKYSLQYSSRMTSSKVMVVIFCCWFYSIIISVLPLPFKILFNDADGDCVEKLESIMARDTIDKLSVCLLYFPCIIIILGSYCRIFRIASYHYRSIQAVDRSVIYNYPSHRVQRSLKYVRSLTVLLIPFLLSTLPGQVCRFFVDTDKKVHFYLELLTSVNIVLNPFIYAYNRSEFKNALSPPTRSQNQDEHRREEEIGNALSIILGKEDNGNNRPKSEDKQNKENNDMNDVQKKDTESLQVFRRRNASFSRLSVTLSDYKGDMQLTLEDLDCESSPCPSLQLSVEKFGQTKRRVTVCRSYSTSSINIQEFSFKSSEDDNDICKKKTLCNKYKEDNISS
ncbi:ADORA2A [Mytilus coruscus]|uniref:ADORA2A n=1 Tax=Mytilus coruscus TaxID=42192 RepID=A0A6J8BVG0_MYTCO|nr:ADORA2A [Mytilus coruscus]